VKEDHMARWKMPKLNSRDVYRFVADDVSDAVQRYFAPAIALMRGVQNAITRPETGQKKKLQQEKSSTA
jgi:hypothetical protein